MAGILMKSIESCPKASFSGNRSENVPLLGANSTRSHYRRSKVCKAPRKRSFIANMSKYNPLDGTAGYVSMSVAVEAFPGHISTPCLDCGDGAGNNGRPVARPFFGGDDDSSFGGASFLFAPSPAVLIGAAVLAGALYFGMPTSASKAQELPSRTGPTRTSPSGPTASIATFAMPSFARASAPVMGTGNASSALCLSAPLSNGGARATPAKKGSTGPGTAPEGAIWYGQVELSAGEKRLLGRRQMHFRETLRSESVSRI